MVFEKLKQRLSGGGGGGGEGRARASGSVTGVGQTERMVSRAERIKKKLAQKAQGAAADGGDATKAASSEPSSPKLNGSGHLTTEEVVKRTSSSVVTQELIVGTKEEPIHMEYAYWTQRGYYPDTPHKENQDTFGITPKFAGEEQGAMLAVYDGHGTEGHACALFAQKKLPVAIAKYLRQARVLKYKSYLERNNIKSPAFDPAKWPLLSIEEYQGCCRKGIQECNEAMHKAQSFDDRLSGTTAASVHFHGDLMTVCNVGDSRVVLGHRETPTADEEENKEEEKEEIDAEPKQKPSSRGWLLPIPLSRDQTPYRKDERERVKKLGACIMSIDQMENQEQMHEDWGDFVLGELVDIHGDPPRVWVEGKDYPGCAFTRSLGDYYAEDIGVTAEPEMVSTRLTSDDQVLIIATDGIFEFVSNNEAMKICSRSANPLMACQSLVEAAYDQWLIHENRTDDITVIVCFLKCSKSYDGEAGTTKDLISEAKRAQHTNKPLAIHASRYGTGAGGGTGSTNSLADTTATTSLDSDASTPMHSAMSP